MGSRRRNTRQRHSFRCSSSVRWSLRPLSSIHTNRVSVTKRQRCSVLIVVSHRPTLTFSCHRLGEQMATSGRVLAGVEEDISSTTLETLVFTLFSSSTIWLLLRVIAFVGFVVICSWHDFSAPSDVSFALSLPSLDSRSWFFFCFFYGPPKADAAHEQQLFADATFQQGNRMMAKIHVIKVSARHLSPPHQSFEHT
jgi:hypothetical protein